MRISDWSSDVCSSDLHQLWYRPFIDLDGRHAGSHVREAETGLLANGQPAWLRVVEYWRSSGLLGSASGRPGASDCGYAGMNRYVSPSCRAFVIDTDRKSTRLNSSH